MTLKQRLLLHAPGLTPTAVLEKLAEIKMIDVWIPTAINVPLRDPKSDVSIAIIPGGITNRKESPRLVSLGTLFYEPLWLFSHNQHLETHEQLRNLRISIGPEGSASHKLALEFLARVGVFEQKSATLLSLTPEESSAKLMNGDIDAVVLIGVWETPAVRQLLVAKDIDLVPIRRADAFVDLYPFCEAGCKARVNDRLDPTIRNTETHPFYRFRLRQSYGPKLFC